MPPKSEFLMEIAVGDVINILVVTRGGILSKIS